VDGVIGDYGERCRIDEIGAGVARRLDRGDRKVAEGKADVHIAVAALAIRAQPIPSDD